MIKLVIFGLLGVILTTPAFAVSEEEPLVGISMPTPPVMPASTPPTPGDSNGDGVVDDTDLVAVGSNFGDIARSEVYLPGDLTYDGRVDLNDLNLVRNHWTGHIEIQPPLTPSEEQDINIGLRETERNILRVADNPFDIQKEFRKASGLLNFADKNRFSKEKLTALNYLRKLLALWNQSDNLANQEETDYSDILGISEDDTALTEKPLDPKQEIIVLDLVEFTDTIRAIHMMLHPPARLHPWLKWLLYYSRITPEMIAKYYEALRKRDMIYNMAFQSDGKLKVRYRNKIYNDIPYYVWMDDAEGKYELIMIKERTGEMAAQPTPSSFFGADATTPPLTAAK